MSNLAHCALTRPMVNYSLMKFNKTKCCVHSIVLISGFFSTLPKKLKDEKLKTQGKISKLKHKTKGFGKSGKNQGK